MKKEDTLLIGLSVLLFLGAPYIPSALLFKFFNTALGAFVLLVAVLLSVGYSKLGSIAFILAVGALFIEHRKRAITIVKAVAETKATEESYESQLVSAPPIIPTELHPPFEMADETVVGYKPMEDTSNEFEAVGTSINHKTDLGGVRLPEKTEQLLIEQGLAERQD
jgi:hypothetical protein